MGSTAAPSREIWVKHQGHHLACLAHENPGAQRLPVVWIHGLTMSLRHSHRFFLKIAALCYGRRWRTFLRLPVVDETLRAVFPDVRRHSIAAQRALCRFLLDMDLTDGMDNILAPVLIVVGAKDPVIRPEHQIDCAKRLKNGRLLNYQGVGHLAFAEVPERFERDLLAWLDRHG